MFLAGFTVPRWKYFIMGAGFVAVQLLEVGYGILTGDMLHRWRVSAVPPQTYSYQPMGRPGGRYLDHPSLSRSYHHAVPEP